MASFPFPFPFPSLGSSVTEHADRFARLVTSGRALLVVRNRKNSLTMLSEIIILRALQGRWPRHYIECNMYRKGVHIADFATSRDLDLLNAGYVRLGGTDDDLKDKFRFQMRMEAIQVATPRILGVIEEGVFRGNAGTYSLSQGQRLQFEAAFMDLVNYSPEDVQTWFVKPRSALKGDNAFRVRCPDDLWAHSSRIQKGTFLIQEDVKQHDDLGAFYPGSVNTVRVLTHRTPRDNDVRIVSAYMKFGSRGSQVDNGAAGGLVVPIDRNTWTLSGDAFSSMKYGGHIFVHHPDTGLPFHGFRLPFGKEIADVALAAAKEFGGPVLGWDVAVTPAGPLLIEGNAWPDLNVAQAACGGFKRHAEYRDMLERLAES